MKNKYGRKEGINIESTPAMSRLNWQRLKVLLHELSLTYDFRWNLYVEKKEEAGE